MTAATIDAANAALFGTLAADWWNPDGSSRLLHRINPVRLAYVRDAAADRFGLDRRARRPLARRAALDIGCGAGLVAEPLARMGAAVTGIDAAPENIGAAAAHAADQGLTIDYRAGEAADLALERPAAFDLVTILEVVEHVADVSTFLATAASLLKPGGLLVFSTPNRTALSRLVMITGAERIARIIPEGGHDWRQFRTPAELTADLAAAGMRVADLRGLSWSLARGFHLSSDKRVNYIGTAVHA